MNATFLIAVFKNGKIYGEAGLCLSAGVLQRRPVKLLLAVLAAEVECLALEA
jgi:hypothetical protein